jgi:hypothetical protein
VESLSLEKPVLSAAAAVSGARIDIAIKKRRAKLSAYIFAISQA